MVIAGYSGIGKTFFADHVNGAHDLPCMPYKYYLPPADKSEFEACKANPSYMMREEWPGNYIKAISNEMHRYRYLLIPSDKMVLKGLRSLDIPYILAYPQAKAKQVYEARYKGRGNTKDFLDIFIGHWDSFMSSLQGDRMGIPVVLGENEFLMEKKELLDGIIDEKECQMEFEIPYEVLQKLEETLSFGGLSVAEYCRRVLIYTVRHPHKAKEIFLKNSEELLPVSDHVAVQDLINRNEGRLQTAKRKMERYEAYYRASGRWAHPVLANEENEICDGYTTFALAKRFGVPADIVIAPQGVETCKVVMGRHVEWFGGTYRNITEKRYVWRYEKRRPVIPGDVLTVSTARGDALMRVDEIGYMTRTAAGRHKTVKGFAQELSMS